MTDNDMFIFFSKQLLSVYEKYTRKSPDKNSIITDLIWLGDKIDSSFDRKSFVLLIRYLNFFYVKPNFTDSIERIPIYNSDCIDREFEKDPSDPDILFALAVKKIRCMQTTEGTHLLKRLSYSGFSLKRYAMDELARID